MSGLVVLVVALVLCFFGIGSIHLAILASGFGLSWVLADLFHVSAGTALLIALAGAVIAWVTVTLVFKVGSFFVGAIVGGLIGAKLSAVLQSGQPQIAVSVILVLAFAVALGFLADRFTKRVLLWITAIGGAGMVLSSLGAAFPDHLAFLRQPTDGRGGMVTIVLWAVLAAAGWHTQRRLFPRALGLEEKRKEEHYKQELAAERAKNNPSTF